MARTIIQITAWLVLGLQWTDAAMAQLTNKFDAGQVDMRCGEYCLAAALGALEIATPSNEEIEKRLGQPTQLGYSMEQLSRVAKSYGAHTLGVVTSLDELQRRSERFVCIALIENRSHYVCIFDVDKHNVYIVDPPVHRLAARDAFSKLWGGKALLISAGEINPQPPNYGSAWILIVAIGVVLVALLAGKKWLWRRSGV